jgi:hypothetical protein
MDRASFAELVEATKSAHPLWFDLPSDAKADAEALRQVQRRLGIQLPDDYAWFLSEYGGGRFTFAEIYSADDRSDLHLVDVQPVDGGADILAFSDNGCGGPLRVPSGGWGRRRRRVVPRPRDRGAGS